MSAPGDSSALLAATIALRAREAADAIQVLRGLLQSAGYDLGAFPLERVYEAERVARDIAGGRDDFDKLPNG